MKSSSVAESDDPFIFKEIQNYTTLECEQVKPNLYYHHRMTTLSLINVKYMFFHEVTCSVILIPTDKTRFKIFDCSSFSSQSDVVLLIQQYPRKLLFHC